MSTVTIPMLAAVDSAIEAVRGNHPDVPEVVVVLGSTGRKGKSQVHGHFASKAWTEKDGESRVHELFLSGESLQRGGLETMGTIIHELVHAYCDAKNISDTSNSGRYHNKKFREAGEEFGLELESAPTIGWSVTTVPDGTAAEYADQIKALDDALVAYRDHFQLAAQKTSKKFKMQCPECQDPIATGKKWFERNEFKIQCHKHNLPFEFIEEEGE